MRHMRTEDIAPISQVIKGIVEKGEPASLPGARAYDAHARMNMGKARKSIAMRRIVVRLGV